MKRIEEMNLWDRLYVPEIIKGVFVTGGTLVKNFTIYVLSLFRLTKERPWATVEYPNEIKPYPERYRGRHRLTLNDDGSVRCTACFLCATACPAKCIYIQPAEHPDKQVEKFPDRYEIDTLLCVYCGYCVEACPVDAIRMDTGIHPEIYPPDPRLYREDKETLMMRPRILEDKGPDALIKEHLERMQRVESNPEEEDLDKSF